MPWKDIFNPLCALGARTCEKSPIAAQLLRNLNFKGKGRIVQRIRSLAMEREVLANCGGIQYRLDLGDDVQREIYFNIYERSDLKFALELVPAGGTCLDIGANSGAFALPFARRVGPAGRVHAYEPDPVNFRRLLANCHLNEFDQILQCHAIAVSNVTGSLPFHRSAPNHSGWGSLVEFSDIAVETDTVETTTLDSIVASERLGQVDLLKVDVEAHEPELLEGAQAALASHVFRFILIEFNGIRLAERGKTLDDFLRPFMTAGYHPVKLRTELMEKMVDGVVPPGAVVTNFLFAPTDANRT